MAVDFGNDTDIIIVSAPEQASVINIETEATPSALVVEVPGAPGPPGPTGPANSLAIGTVTTAPPGGSATADITGIAPSQTLNLTIPRGAIGAIPTLAIGTVSTGPAAATFTGTPPSYTLNLTIPQGIQGTQGIQGIQGPAGPPNTLAIGTVTTGAAGSSASATVTGTAPNQTLNLTIPTGPQGPPGSGAPDATTTSKGSVKLAGDLAGTADLPVVTAGTDAQVNSAIVRRSASGTIAVNRVYAEAGPPAAGFELTRKDYVDGQFAASRRRGADGTLPATYTLALTDEGMLRYRNAGPAAVTIPAFATVAFPIGSWVDFMSGQAGTLTIIPASGVIIIGPDGQVVPTGGITPRSTWGTVRLQKYATDSWIISGDTATVTDTDVTAATPLNTFGTLMRRNATGHVEATSVDLANSPAAASHATRRDYVDTQVATRATTSHTHTSADISDSTTIGRTILTAVDGPAVRTAIGAGTSSLALGSTGTTAAAGNHTHVAANITDSTTVGRAVLTAIDATAARTAIGAGTSNLVVGTAASDAKAGNYQPTAANISDSTAVGRSVLTAVDATAARTAIGAGTGSSNLVIGTTNTTAKAGDYQPTAANISDSTAVGRSVITAVDATAARTAIGAGTSNLAIGTTSATAKAGDYQPTSANITDATTIGRTVLTSADATAVRTAIGAGTSNLVLGTTNTTAKAGDYQPTSTNISDSTAIGRSILTSVDAAAVRAATGTLAVLTPTATKTAAYTVAANELAVMNVAGGATVLNLPTAPTDKMIVAFRAIGATTAVPLTVNRGGTATIGDSGATSVTEPMNGVTRTYQYNATTTAWFPISDVKPLSALDTRYAAIVHTHVATTDLTATGTPSATTFLRGDNTWSTPPTPSAATSAAAGIVQLSTDAEALAGTNTVKTTTPANGKATYAYKQLTKNTITTAYTLVLADASDVVLHTTSATAVTITLPSDATAAIPQEVSIPWRQFAAGQITFAAGSGATLISRGSVFRSAGQNAEGLITKVAANQWLLSGDIVT